MIGTILAFAYFIFSMFFLLPFGTIALIFYILGLRNLMTLAVYRIAQGWARLFLWLFRCKVTVSGTETIPRKGGVCFVSNHEGIFDIVLIFAYCGRPVGFIAKKELSYVPFLNVWIFLIGGLFIDRGVVRKAIRTINIGVERIKKGRGMIIFPEGHRSKGEGLLPFHPGALKLATQAGAPIVPVALKGSYDFYEKNRRLTRTVFKVVFCEPIYTADLPPEDKKIILCDRIYSVIKERWEG
ncbi:MAG: 1-acyl-sn-glycerol-3-phosphate acyltransferase [Treponema sp.]|jgi:1-acyl-sn-glycerol-3-phosphate acyltransferase|nr:1-acyl-sn-glycerol-3-phosphate acyltransferase [Treponema sp.]